MDKREEYDIERSWSLGEGLSEDQVFSPEEQLKLSGMLDGIETWSSTKEKPSPRIKSALLAEFKTSQSKKSGIWLNGFWPWLLPAEKSWFKTPAFQMLAVAGCAVIIFLMVNQIDDKVSENQLADHNDLEQVKEQDKRIEKQKNKVDEVSAKREENVELKSKDKETLNTEIERFNNEGVSMVDLNSEDKLEEESVLDAQISGGLELVDEVADNVPAPPDGYSNNNAESAIYFSDNSVDLLATPGSVQVKDDNLNKLSLETGSDEDNEMSRITNKNLANNTTSTRNGKDVINSETIVQEEKKESYKSEKRDARKKKTESFAKREEAEFAATGSATPSSASKDSLGGNVGTTIVSKSVNLLQSGDSDMLNLLYTAF